MPTRTCPQGHKYTKTSDCPTCPECAVLAKPEHGLLSLLSAPARRALESIGVENAEQLSTYTEKEILALHGIGKASLPAFHKALKDAGLTFRAG